MKDIIPAVIRRVGLPAVFLILITADGSRCQSLGVSPYSFKAIGGVQATSELYFQYEWVGVHYFHAWDNEKFITEEDQIITQKSSSLALSVSPLQNTHFNAGVIYFKNKFPVTVGNRLHFMLSLSLPLDRITISYKHISNGFGLIYEMNPGLDTISVQFNF